MRKVTLSFDNGPWPGITDHVLSVLDEFAIRATFFLVGERLLDPVGARLAREAHSAGHWIGNHSMTHGVPLGLRREPDAAAREIGAMDALLGDLASPDRLFRPNGRGRLGPHLLSGSAVDYLAATHSTIVLWTSVPKDRGVPAQAWIEDAKQSVSVTDWSLLVLHDRPSGHDIPAGSMAYLASFLSWLRDSDVEIVQEFPASCVPMRRGAVLQPMDDLMTP